MYDTKALIHYLAYDMFRDSEGDMSFGKRFFLRLLKKIVLAVREFFNDNLTVKAAALTFYTVLALVPIAALILAIGRGFGFQETIENFIKAKFSMDSDLVPYILQFVQKYLDQIKGGVFVGIGLAVLLWSVVSMFRQIERSFNAIWNVKKSRSIIRQFTSYLTLLVLIPILIVISSGLAVQVNNIVELIGQSDVGMFFGPIYQFGVRLLPFVIYWLVFTLLFLIIPNTKVKFVHAFLAGVIIGTVFLFLQKLYVGGQINLSRYNAVYGSFAAIPLLLFWLQISWYIVLFGAEFSYVSQNLATFSFEKDTKQISRRFMDYIILLVVRIIIDEFKKGARPLSAEQISTEYNIPLRLVQNSLKILTDIDIVSEIYVESDERLKTYQPALDINKITLNMLYDRIERKGSEEFKLKQTEESSRLWNAIEQLHAKMYKTDGQILIKDL